MGYGSSFEDSTIFNVPIRLLGNAMLKKILGSLVGVSSKHIYIHIARDMIKLERLVRFRIRSLSSKSTHDIPIGRCDDFQYVSYQHPIYHPLESICVL